MISIFNKKLDFQINIGKVDWITFMPREFEEVPNVVIEMKNGFNFMRHGETCKECGKFLSDFGSNTLDWFIKYDDKIKRLDLSTLGSKEYFSNHIVFTNSIYDYGTRLKLIIHPLTTEKEDIQKYLAELIEREDYETACLVRDLDKPVE